MDHAFECVPIDFVAQLHLDGALARSSGKSFAREFSVFVEGDAINFDTPAGAKVHDHVPVQAGLIGVAGFGVACANREVNSASDLFIKEGVARIALNMVIGADGTFAQESASGVGIKHGDEKILALGR